jgi:glycogen synthase kinase 3 beta
VIYSPKQRLNAAEALAHEFFDELREEAVYRQINKHYGISLFSFMPEELKGQEHLVPKLIPPWLKEHKEYAFF